MELKKYREYGQIVIVLIILSFTFPAWAGGLGKSRADILLSFVKSGFKESTEYKLNDGRQLVQYKSNSKTCYLELIGPGRNVQEVSIMAGMPSDSVQIRTMNLLFMYLLATIFDPTIDPNIFAKWIDDSLNQSKKIEKIIKTYKISIKPLKILGMISMSVKPIE